MRICEPSPDLTTVPDAAWAKANVRFKIPRRLAEKPRRTRADVIAAAAQIRCSTARTYTLLARFVADPTLTSLLPRRRGPLIGTSYLRPELDALIDQVLESMYLSKQRARVADVVREVRRRCYENQLRPPGRKAIMIRMRQKPRATVVARREGGRAARNRFAPVLGSLESPRPLAIVQIDHTLVDVIVVDSVTRAPIQRPWLTVAIDVHSRCITGLHLSLEPPSATSVALCVSHAALPKEAWLAQRSIEAEWPVSGVPDTLHLDNAKEFRSEALRRGCEQHGIYLEYRPVRTPHYGGHIERLIGTLMGKVHLLPGTTYSGIDEKGDVHPEKTATMTLDEVERWLGHAVAGVYHRDFHRGISTTPLAAWSRGIASRSPPIAVSDARRFLIDFLPIERRLVRREGIQLNSISYWSDVLATWIGHPDPMIVRYDPKDLSRIYLMGPDGIYYDIAYRDVRRAPISRWEQRRAVKRLRDEGFTHVDEAAIFRAVDTMRAITEAASAKTKSARREHERRRRIPTTALAAPDRPLAAERSDHANHEPESTTEVFPVEEWT